MFNSMSIRLKIVLLSGLCLLGVTALIVGMNLYQSAENNQLTSASSKQMLTASVERLLEAQAAEQAVRLQRTFNENLLVTRSLADQVNDLRALATRVGMPASELRAALNQSVKSVFERNTKVLGVWMVFEPNALDGRDAEFVDDLAHGSNETGRFSSGWTRSTAQRVNIVITEGDLGKTELSISGTPYNSWYTCPRERKSACLLEPYADTLEGKRLLMTSLSIPLMDGDKVIATVGVDLELAGLQAAASEAQRGLFDNAGRVLIVSPVAPSPPSAPTTSRSARTSAKPRVKKAGRFSPPWATRRPACSARTITSTRSTRSAPSTMPSPGVCPSACRKRFSWPTR
ncbi:cache domain-containing protein [Pseudomonas sp. OHS18]|uniref:cache domain-containing protein n=1 Tax=Pseudomonas sp. OHS18 TaxID=3399679 RepID=UPI003A8B3DCF